MWRNALRGLAAGAVGTTALNLTTYGDIALRGRPSSSVPAQVAGKVAEGAGINLFAGNGGAPDERAENRRQGAGTLFGYMIGLTGGITYGLLRPRLGRVPVPLAGAALGLLAMAGSDVPPTALGITRPKTWRISGWASDLVPHLAYGLVTVLTYEAFTRR